MAENFGVARAVSVLVEVVGWCGVVGAVASVAMSYGQRDPLPFLYLAGALVLGGLLAVVAGQFARAQIATAESSGETAELLRDLLAAVRDLPRGPTVASAGTARAGGVSTKDLVKTYKGHQIQRGEIGFKVDGVGNYTTVLDAEKSIDGMTR